MQQIQEARNGNRRAINYWKLQHARIWQQQEIDAVNYFRKHRRQFDVCEALPVSTSVWLRRDIQNGFQQAEVLSVCTLPEYVLIKCKYIDEVVTYWMAHLTVEEGIVPIADVTMWHGGVQHV